MKERCAAPWDANELEHDGERVTVDPHATGNEEDLAVARVDLVKRADAMVRHLDATLMAMRLSEKELAVLRLRFGPEGRARSEAFMRRRFTPEGARRHNR